jgi:hypothetical protein
MRKTMLYRFLGLGGLSRPIREQLEAEGIILLDEGLPGWLVERNVRLPGGRSLYRVRSCTGTLAISTKRVLVQTYQTVQFDLPREDPRLQKLHVALRGIDRVVLSFDYQLIHADWRGNAQLRLKTAQAPRFYETLVDWGVQNDGAGLAMERSLL